MKKLSLALPAILAIAALVACSGDDDEATPTATQPAATSPTAAVSATPPAGATATVRPTSVGTAAPPVDGTVPAQGFGSTDPFTIKANPDPTTNAALLQDVRVGAHPEEGGWDRIVFEFADVRPAGEVRYVNSAAQCGSGEPVDPAGDAMLLVRFDATNAHTEAGQATLDSRHIVGPGNVILESIQICDFEAVVEWVIGVESMQRFTVRLLENPTRVVIDVKQ